MPPDLGPTVIVGQGSLGTFFAVLLAKAGHDVHVISSRAGEPEDVTLNVTGRHELSEQVTLRGAFPDRAARFVFLCQRAEEAIEHAPEALDALEDTGVLVPVQNGLASLDIAQAVGRDRVTPMVVGFNAGMPDERTVEKTSRGGVTLAWFSPGARRVAEPLAEDLRRTIPAKLTDNPRGAVWSKWCISCAINGLAVVTGSGVGALTKRKQGRDALIGIVSECVQLADAEGVELERVAGPLTPSTLAGSPDGLGGMVRQGVVWLIGKGYGSVVPSSLDALQAGRDTELAAINGTAIERGDRHRIPTPWNEAVLALGEEIQAGKIEPSLGLLEDLTTRARRA